MQTGEIIKKYILIAVGCLSLALGIIGIFLPLLPTTPFLLLAAYCFTRSSARLYGWLIHHKTLGSYIYHYQTYRAVTRKTKVMAIVFLWGSLGLSMVLLASLYIRLLLIAVGAGVTLYILSLRILK
ncbi:MAG TPA: YbaN family protein [Selenomonadales bacterium]|nr:YbaN family protein [Selenomonadales bacterium]